VAVVITTTNEKGQKIYHLARIADLAGLPEAELEKALEMLPVLIHGLRLAGFAAGIPEDRIPAMGQEVIHWVADDLQSANYRSMDGDEVFGISIKEKEAIAQ
jgi:hypothetical protein